MRHRVTLRICAQYAGPNLLGRITAFRDAVKVQHELRNTVTPWDVEEEIKSISPQSASETERSDEGSHNSIDVQSFQSREQSIDDEKNKLLGPTEIVDDTESVSRYRARKRGKELDSTRRGCTLANRHRYCSEESQSDAKENCEDSQAKDQINAALNLIDFVSCCYILVGMFLLSPE